MKQVAAAILLALSLAGCAAYRAAGEEAGPPSLVPPPDTAPPPTNPATDAQLAELQTSMTELLERLDVLNSRIAKLEAAEGESRVVVTQAQPRAAEPVPTRAVEPVPAPRAVEAPARVPAPTPAPVRAPAPVSGPLQSAAIADSYRDALILYGKGRMPEARAAMQRIFDAEPSGELADNALYWIGETYFAASDYSSAMRSYERVTKEYPEQNKAPDAMFKIGLTFEKTGDFGMAKKTFEEVIRRYPYSTASSSAKLELKRVKY
jgi:tol-pal system protein YbgF